MRREVAVPRTANTTPTTVTSRNWQPPQLRKQNRGRHTTPIRLRDGGLKVPVRKGVLTSSAVPASVHKNFTGLKRNVGMAVRKESADIQGHESCQRTWASTRRSEASFQVRCAIQLNDMSPGSCATGSAGENGFKFYDIAATKVYNLRQKGRTEPEVGGKRLEDDRVIEANCACLETRGLKMLQRYASTRM